MATIKSVKYTGAFYVNNGNLKELFGNGGSDTFNINQMMYATGAGSRAYVDMGAGNDRFTLSKGIRVDKGANSEIKMGAGNDTINTTFMTAHDANSVNKFDMGDGKDYVKLSQFMYAETGGRNIIDMGTGAGDEVHVHGRMEALSGGMNSIIAGAGSTLVHLDQQMIANGGTNEIALGQDADKVQIDKAVLAYANGVNQVSTGAGDDVLNVCCDVIAYSNGINVFNLGAGNDQACFNTSIQAQGVGALNSILAGAGNDVMSVKYTVAAVGGGSNRFDMGEGNDYLYIGKGTGCKAPYALYADGGSNRISLGEGDDIVLLDGKVGAFNGGTNYVDAGAGHDWIVVDGHVNAGGLGINGGAGYDTLVLVACNGREFNANYQSWLTAPNSAGNISYEGYGNLESIQVKLSSLCTIKDISPWIKDFADGYSTFHGKDLDLQININNNGSTTSLKDIFGKTAFDLFDHVDMGGGCKNTLNISGTFTKNGYDNNELFVTGDYGDRVKLSRDWTDSQQNHEYTVEGKTFTYDVYTNALSGDQLYIEHGLLVYGC